MPIRSQKKNQIADVPPLVVKHPEPIPESAVSLSSQSDNVVQKVSDIDDSSIDTSLDPGSIKDPDTNDIKARWPAFLDVLLKERSNLGSFLSSGYIDSVAPGVIDLKFSPSCRFQYLEITKKNNLSEITKVLQDFLGELVELRITLDVNVTETQDVNYIKQIGNIPSTINDDIEKEPIIQTILDVFDGEVLN